MKVLFVSSGNSKKGITSLILNQGNSLAMNGINIDYFSINRRGIKGYIQSIMPLKKKLKQGDYDLIHAHYSFSGFMCSLSLTRTPIIVSLMGSDVKETKAMQLSSKFFAKYFWKRIIVKSKDLKSSLGVDKAIVIPNGINMTLFLPMDQSECQHYLGWDTNKKHLLFAADPKRRDKNFLLAKTAIEFLNNKEVQLHFLDNVKHIDVPKYMNASDVVLLSSPYEGSPNVIKEAMACNSPIVTTDVGDVREVIGNTRGCFIVGFDPESFAWGIEKALSWGKRTSGRERVQHLESSIIANRIIDLYKETIK
jgi:teichuronic acid biosynthesis glycosyltransferase TuaC